MDWVLQYISVFLKHLKDNLVQIIKKVKKTIAFRLREQQRPSFQGVLLVFQLG
jgi:hypothetical protein